MHLESMSCILLSQTKFLLHVSAHLSHRQEESNTKDNMCENKSIPSLECVVNAYVKHSTKF
jgi:hypothetical protein